MMFSSSRSSEDPLHHRESFLSIYPLGVSIKDPVGVLKYHYGDGSIPDGGVPPVALSLVVVSPNGDTTYSFLDRTKELHSVDNRVAGPLYSDDQARILYENAVGTIARLRVSRNASYKGQPNGPAVKTERAKLIAEQNQTFYLMVAHRMDSVSVPVVVDIFWRKNKDSSWQSIWCTMSDDGIEVRSEFEVPPEFEGHAEQLTKNQKATLQLWFKIFLAELDRRDPDSLDLREGQEPINISTTNR
ncbi:hypothetical protein HG444_002170 [Candidatus Saccharibacteria bacterium]|nr:hypothetical protein [Candidatus Saccharibacteria bacterium]